MAAICACIEPFVEPAAAICPFHFGSVRSKIEAGSSASETRSLLYMMTRARRVSPVTRYRRREIPGNWSAPAGSTKRKLLPRQRLHREQLGRDEHVRLRVGLLLDQRVRQFAVAPRLEQDFHIRILRLERVDDGLDERLGATRIDNQSA
ncbi:MAG: hypothetical protein MZV64_17230 [Ignavibacteriales bacterium]|nr:hypothetical protein [Ignavibacteriales bacterium]